MSTSSSQFRPARVRIDPAAMQHNLGVARELCPDASIMAVIKADGYGHGLEVAAAALGKADLFGVNGLDDVLRLRKKGMTQPIAVLSASFDSHQLSLMNELDVQPVIYEFDQIELLQQCDTQQQFSVWLKVDTGMGRLGFLANDVTEALQQLQGCSSVKSIGLMSHMANADSADPTTSVAQISSVNEIFDAGGFSARSLLNSAGMFSQADAAYDVVRPGAMLFGISPLSNKSAVDLNLRASMNFESEIISIKSMPAGSGIGYGADHVLEKDTRIGVIACGYGDGYPRHAKSGTPVWVNGNSVPLIGRVSMDMIVVDLGELPANIGDRAVLWGTENPVEEVARWADTIAYELVCGILPRVERIKPPAENSGH